MYSRFAGVREIGKLFLVVRIPVVAVAQQRMVKTDLRVDLYYIPWTIIGPKRQAAPRFTNSLATSLCIGLCHEVDKVTSRTLKLLLFAHRHYFTAVSQSS